MKDGGQVEEAAAFVMKNRNPFWNHIKYIVLFPPDLRLNVAMDL